MKTSSTCSAFTPARSSEHLELLDELEPPHVVVGVDALTAIQALHRFEEAPLLVVADCPLGHPDLRGQLPDPVTRRRRRRHVRQFTSTGSLPRKSSRQAFAEPRGDVVERLALGGSAVVGRELDPEAVSLPPRDHVEVRVEDLLAGRRSVREVEVDGFAAQSGDAEARGDAARERPHRDGGDLVHLADRRGVLSWDHDGVALVDRMDVEERDRVASLRDEPRLLVAFDDPAEDASGVLGHVASSLMAFASACAPRAASAIDANSRGVCDPPVERTKIMPVGTPESAGFCASWPAPLTRRGASTPTLLVARFRTSRIFGSSGVTGTRARSSTDASTPRAPAMAVRD